MRGIRNEPEELKRKEGDQDKVIFIRNRNHLSRVLEILYSGQRWKSPSSAAGPEMMMPSAVMEELEKTWEKNVELVK